ncbi:hypothetical protein [Streptomyces sp. NPDC059272]|uniref:hypothetical protein n=1 Tax=Streptomyces sp. NPDC059272 TaxID=3346800 RepID=UPI00368F4408
MADALLELRLSLGERVARAGGAVGRRKGCARTGALITFKLGALSALPPLPLSSWVDLLTSATGIAERSDSAVVSLPVGRWSGMRSRLRAHLLIPNSPGRQVVRPLPAPALSPRSRTHAA